MRARQIAVLSYVLKEHPAFLSVDELRREMVADCRDFAESDAPHPRDLGVCILGCVWVMAGRASVWSPKRHETLTGAITSSSLSGEIGRACSDIKVFGHLLAEQIGPTDRVLCSEKTKWRRHPLIRPAVTPPRSRCAKAGGGSRWSRGRSALTA